MTQKIIVFLLMVFTTIFLTGCGSEKKYQYSYDYNQDIDYICEFEQEIGNRVYFALNKSDLSIEAKKILDLQAEWLIANGISNITIEGHCDDRGTREYNIALGEKRAESVKSYLVYKGFNPNQIQTVSYGKEKPAVIGNNEEAWGMNRRAITAIK